MVHDYTSPIKSIDYVEQLLCENISHFLTVTKKSQGLILIARMHCKSSQDQEIINLLVFVSVRSLIVMLLSF